MVAAACVKNIKTLVSTKLLTEPNGIPLTNLPFSQENGCRPMGLAEAVCFQWSLPPTYPAQSYPMKTHADSSFGRLPTQETPAKVVCLSKDMVYLASCYPPQTAACEPPRPSEVGMQPDFHTLTLFPQTHGNVAENHLT